MSKLTTSRRDFLRSSAGTATAIGIAGACGGCAWFNKNDIEVETKPDAAEATLTFEKFPQLKNDHGVVHIAAKDGDLRLIVLRQPGGKVVALSMECTHWGCDVDWDKAQGCFDCPCHGSRFDTAGKVLEGPADEPLPVYEVEESADGVIVRFTRLLDAPAGG